MKAVWAWMLMLGVLLVAGTSCERLYESEGDCNPYYYLRFVYDKTLPPSDAFSKQVESVDVYVFDANGTFVKHYADKGEALGEIGYRIPLDLEPGDYQFVAWCGLDGNEGHFAVPESIARPEDLTCKMARKYGPDGLAYSDYDLHPLFHGKVTATLPDTQGEHVVTVFLMKDINYISLSLNHMSGALDPERFEVTMEDCNGFMAYDNSLLDDEQIEYRPWSQRGGVLDVETSDTTMGEAGFLVTEFVVARMMKDHDVRISILDKETGNIVFSIPLVKWALQLRSAHYSNMDEQEYLDREDTYNLMVFLQDDEKNPSNWASASIVINGWKIVEQGDMEL